MSLIKFHRTIINSSTQNSESIEDLYLAGRFFNLTYPTTIWSSSGKTFSGGYKPYDVNNNQMYAFEITGEILKFTTVGTGTATPDTDNHPSHLLYIDDSDYLFFLQTDPHLAPINVWRSTTADTIDDGFTFLGQISINSSYMSIVESNDRVLKIATRSAGGSNFSHRMIDVDLDNLAGATSYVLTDAEYGSTATRHYLGSVKKYGNPTKHWVTVSHRYDTAMKWYKHSAYYYTDVSDTTIYNPLGSYSKDTTVSALTATEMENNNFAISGTDADKTIDIRGAYAIQVNNDLYMSQRSTIDTWRITKISGATQTYSPTMTGADDLGKICFEFNGSNLVAWQVVPEGVGWNINIYTIDLNLTAFSLRETFYTSTFYYPDFPNNLDEVTGIYSFLYGSEAGVVNWVSTNEKWN